MRNISTRLSTSQNKTMKKTLKKFDIWEEGFRVMEASSTANLIARGVEGTDFLDACKRYFKKTKDTLFNIRNGVPNRWGCRLFDNEADARKVFG